MIEIWQARIKTGDPQGKDRSLALRDELGRVPTHKEIEQVFLLTRMMYKAVLRRHYRREEEQRRAGQLALF